ncbi:MAG: GGDEF domain-containing protein [bacterium]
MIQRISLTGRTPLGTLGKLRVKMANLIVPKSVQIVLPQGMSIPGIVQNRTYLAGTNLSAPASLADRQLQLYQIMEDVAGFDQKTLVLKITTELLPMILPGKVLFSKIIGSDPGDMNVKMSPYQPKKSFEEQLLAENDLDDKQKDIIKRAGAGKEIVHDAAGGLLAFPYLLKDNKPFGAALLEGTFSKDDVDVIRYFALKILPGVFDKAVLYEQAALDSLTELHNRRSFDKYISEEEERANRYKHCFTVAYIDFDNFKIYNDTRGHNEGDMALRELADVIRKHIRNKIDKACRIGGDEFAIIFPETSKQEAKKVLQRILRDMNSFGIQLSIGAAEFPKDASSKEELRKLADERLYTVKNNGRNGIVLD